MTSPAARVAVIPVGLSLVGKVIGIDPGHNGANYRAPTFINHPVWNGRAPEACDTTGTATVGGYTEALFNFKISQYLAKQLRARGARVVFTRTTNTGVGPCIDQRAAILNQAKCAVAIDIHADGGPASGRGFAVLEPVRTHRNTNVLGASYRFGAMLRDAMLRGTTIPVSTYDGVNGVAYRNDLAGLNLTTVPKVLIEVGNMRNHQDAALLTSDAFQQQLANALVTAIQVFVNRPR